MLFSRISRGFRNIPDDTDLSSFLRVTHHRPFVLSSKLNAGQAHELLLAFTRKTRITEEFIRETIVPFVFCESAIVTDAFALILTPGRYR